MRLYTTPTSPYGRIVRIVRLEKKLNQEIVLNFIKTRGDDNPYYKINPSGRVPALVLEDQTVLEDSALIAWYIDNYDNNPLLHPKEGVKSLESRRIEAMARSMLDGTSLWWREYLYRPKSMRSKTIIKHERARALRLADQFESEVQGEVLSGPLNMSQIVLASVLHGRDQCNPEDFPWTERRPKLLKWVENISKINSISETLPPK